MIVYARSGLLLIALILFVLAAFGVQFSVVSIVPLGLAFFAGAFFFHPVA
jgi:hypothetical protein